MSGGSISNCCFSGRAFDFEMRFAFTDCRTNFGKNVTWPLQLLSWNDGVGSLGSPRWQDAGHALCVAKLDCQCLPTSFRFCNALCVANIDCKFLPTSLRFGHAICVATIDSQCLPTSFYRQAFDLAMRFALRTSTANFYLQGFDLAMRFALRKSTDVGGVSALGLITLAASRR